MSKDLKLNAYSRKAKIDSKKEILAVVYGPKKENKNLTIGRVEFEKMLKLAGFSSLIDLVVDEKETEEVKPKKTTTKKKTTKKKVEVNEAAVVEEVAVDESNRASLEEMDSIMRQIVAPTTELWEQEKKDVLDNFFN